MEKPLTGRTLVWAHRGASAYAPQNTLAAFKLAAEMGADGIELDVHLTRDGEVLVCHDAEVDTTSDGTGLIKDLTLAEIKRFDFAYRADSTAFSDKYGFVEAPTLAEVYSLLAPTGMTVNVELKTQDEELLQKCADLAREYGMVEKVWYSSFFHDTLTRIRAYEPEAKTAPLCGPIVGEPWDYVPSLEAQAMHPYHGIITERPEIVGEFHRRGLRLHPWTVDDEALMKTLVDLGVDALITNVPDKARKIAGESK